MKSLDAVGVKSGLVWGCEVLIAKEETCGENSSYRKLLVCTRSVHTSLETFLWYLSGQKHVCKHVFILTGLAEDVRSEGEGVRSYRTGEKGRALLKVDGGIAGFKKMDAKAKRGSLRTGTAPSLHVMTKRSSELLQSRSMENSSTLNGNLNTAHMD